MPSPDLVPTMERVAEIAARVDRDVRSPDRSTVLQCGAILEALTGASPDPDWRSRVGPDAASVVCLAKAVRVMASMLAATAGATIPVAGVLDDLDAGVPASARPTVQERDCITCGVRFRSEHGGNRMCDSCRLATAGLDELPANVAVLAAHRKVRR